jgi:hypothetical protein
MMKKRLDVSHSSVANNTIQLMTKEKITLDEAKQLQATGSMLVDSDGLALIYILENEDDFVYLSISDDHWPVLNKGLENSLTIELSIPTTDGKNYSIELENITAEFHYLKDNIADNANYGEEMVNKFTKVFLPQ